MNGVLFIPAGSAEAADRIGRMVERGSLRAQPHWLSREACQAFIASLPNSGSAGGLIERDITYMATAVRVAIPVAGGAGRSPAIPPAQASACVSGKLFAGDAGLTEPSLALSSVSMTEHHDGACISGESRSEAA